MDSKKPILMLSKSNTKNAIIGGSAAATGCRASEQSRSGLMSAQAIGVALEQENLQA